MIFPTNASAVAVILTIGFTSLLSRPCESFNAVRVIFTSPHHIQRTVYCKPPSALLSQLNTDNEASEETKKNEVFKSNNPLELAAWYGVEAFGKVFRQAKNDNNTENDTGNLGTIDLSKPPSSLKETLARIQLDNDRYYFLSGEVDRLIYDENCVFSDPFVSFKGRDRFIDNLSNLGSFITNYDAKMIEYNVKNDATVINTKVMVKLELNLPWKPVLAWPWGVKYSVDPETCLVTTHEESWDIAPWEGVKQIFRKPTVKINKPSKE
ncbi:hypothetical protein HJC23_011571 [Cyclotella cryptica]|uniref:Plastid lipid-associated protein/fibrillin conserved domain-containing protein n=1 Tax=Cyclotella cryptica TaxID=29204 RepID=A0ABD3QRZ7_9STRA|eukprot:CCRYP_002666-RA/>CCRYP_002666-RA protein AED:0.04 eAED:0.04 QI:154/1/1/1/0.75/0.6/5/1738/265